MNIFTLFAQSQAPKSNIPTLATRINHNLGSHILFLDSYTVTLRCPHSLINGPTVIVFCPFPLRITWKTFL